MLSLNADLGNLVDQSERNVANAFQYHDAPLASLDSRGLSMEEDKFWQREKYHGKSRRAILEEMYEMIKGEPHLSIIG